MLTTDAITSRIFFYLFSKKEHLDSLFCCCHWHITKRMNEQLLTPSQMAVCFKCFIYNRKIKKQKSPLGTTPQKRTRYTNSLAFQGKSFPSSAFLEKQQSLFSLLWWPQGLKGKKWRPTTYINSPLSCSYNSSPEKLKPYDLTVL